MNHKLSTSDALRGTIEDFGIQWKAFQQQDGAFAGEDLFWDYFGPLLASSDLLGREVAEVGCGNGRFLKTISRYAKRVVGIEPSDAVEVARNYCAPFSNISLQQTSVYDLEAKPEFDVVLCLGVLHHLPDSVRALKQMADILKPGGRLVVWVYGQEGNDWYLRIFRPVRRITSRLPHWALNAVATVFTFFLAIYRGLINITSFFPWPMKSYLRNVIGPLSWYHTKVTVYDQLNPTIANYYTKGEVENLAHQAGLHNFSLYHRHGYSWTIKITKS